MESSSPSSPSSPSSSSSSSPSSPLLCRTSTSCATGQRWSTWGALTTMQHNHSHRAASLVRPLRSVPSDPSQPPSTHLNPPPLSPLPEGRRKGRTRSRTRRRGSTNHRDPRRLNQPHEILLSKNNNGNITMTMANMTTLVQTRQRRRAALLCRSQTSLIVKGYW